MHLEKESVDAAAAKNGQGEDNVRHSKDIDMRSAQKKF